MSGKHKADWAERKAGARSYRSEGQLRYEVWPIEKARSIYRFQVVDLESSALIVARCCDRAAAEALAKQLN